MSGVRLSEVIAPAFFPVHEDLRRAGHAEYWLSGGRGSGKSSFVSLEILLGLMRDRRAGAIIYRKVADTLRDSVYAQMLWAIDRLGVAGDWQARLSPMELVHRETGQRILFRGADDPQKSKGVRLRDGYFRYLWFEELSEFDGIDAIRTIKASILRASGEGPDAQTTVLCTYNPPVSPWHWVNREACAPPAGRLAHHSDYRQMPPAWLGDSFLAEAEALHAHNPRAWRHMYLGEVTGTGGQVFENLRLRPCAATSGTACRPTAALTSASQPTPTPSCAALSTANAASSTSWTSSPPSDCWLNTWQKRCAYAPETTSSPATAPNRAASPACAPAACASPPPARAPTASVTG